MGGDVERIRAPEPVVAPPAIEQQRSEDFGSNASRAQALGLSGAGAPDPLASQRTLGTALDQGFQYLIGNDFSESAEMLKRAGSKGAAILDGGDATAEGVAELRQRGVLPYAYNNAFQTQEGEKLPPGVGTIGNDKQWGEAIPDFTNPRWQERRIAEAVKAAKMGFGGVMLDNVVRAGASPEAAQYVKKMAMAAREASGNQAFGLLLQNGAELVKANPWLATEGWISGMQQEDLSYRVGGKGDSVGHATDRESQQELMKVYQQLHAEHPEMPTIAVDYPKTASQAAGARTTAQQAGFHTSHQAVGDGELRKISKETRQVNPYGTP
ncbi:MAG: endo alpha-1,4 polygalactosaminidase [Alphaproteobacteria bacterium]|nr:endo alpha-1,4 polygalactosaminidase [Alphaproteobacteria bacterium]